MNSPRRLLDDPSLSPLARSLLDSARARREPADARSRVAAALGATLATSPHAATAAGAGLAKQTSAGAASGAAATPALLAGLATKAILIAALGAGVALGTRPAPLPEGRSNSSTETTPLVAREQAAPSPANREPPKRLDEPFTATPPLEPIAPAEPFAPSRSARAHSPTAVTPAEPAPIERREPPTPIEAEPEHANSREARETSLREEARLLDAAHAALSRGDAREARAKIADARARFPQGLLVEERDAIDVRVAVLEGDKPRARALAQAFLARYPRSPLRTGLENAAGN